MLDPCLQEINVINNTQQNISPKDNPITFILPRYMWWYMGDGRLALLNTLQTWQWAWDEDSWWKMVNLLDTKDASAKPIFRYRFKCILFNEDDYLLIQFSLDNIAQSLLAYKPTLAQVMAWCYHDCWCHGYLHYHIIINYDIEFQMKMSFFSCL